MVYSLNKKSVKNWEGRRGDLEGVIGWVISNRKI